MLQFLKNILAGHNEFASGGLLLMILGGLSVYLRAVPEAIWYWIVKQTTMAVTVKDDDAAFLWVKEWFLEQKFLKRVRHVDLDTTLRTERIAMIPAPGKHWFCYCGRPFEVWFSRAQNKQSGVTLSGLLNVLDGFCAPTGVLFVMTTNHIEKLDPALLRPGRIDHKLYLGKASDYQKAELYRRFFPERSKAESQMFVEASRSAETMAEFQGRLLALEQDEACLDLVRTSEEMLV